MSWGEWPEKEGRHTRQTRPTYVPSRSSNPWEGLSSAAPPYYPSFSSQNSNPAVSFPNRGRNDRSPSGGVTSSDKSQNTEENPFSKMDEAETENAGINFEAYEDIPVEASGEEVPPPVNTFSDLDLGQGLNLNIQRCKYVRPTPIQRHAIPIVMAGRDLMACAQTGSGKTAAFCFPIISGVSKIKGTERGGGGRGRSGRNTASPVALILSPTRELASQIHDEAKKFAFQTGVKILVVYGGAPIYCQLRELGRGVDVLVATPGRLVDLINRGNISLQRIKYLTLDEADRMLDMGFEPQIRKIVAESGMPPSGVRQTMLFSATFPDEIQRLASDFMSNYIFLSVGRVGSSTDLIEQKVEYVKDMDKRDCLMDLLRGQQANGTNGKLGLTLIFVETKRGADLLERWLLSNGFSATAIHGNKIQMEREQALRSFKNGSCPILVATDVAARGLDVPSVKHVINFDFPRNIDDYVHRIGRTGRAGKSGIATAFFNENNASLAKSLVEIMKEAKQEVPSWLSDIAEAESYEGSERGGRYGGRNNFGGYDFRKSGNFGNGFGEKSYTSNYGDVDSSVNTGTGWKYDTGDENKAGGWNHSTIAYNADYNASASQPYEPGYESIVASGWD